jgi:hypothetical protein
MRITQAPGGENNLGAKLLQKLTRLDIEGWHNALQGGLAARKIGHAHRVLGKHCATPKSTAWSPITSVG